MKWDSLEPKAQTSSTRAGGPVRRLLPRHGLVVIVTTSAGTPSSPRGSANPSPARKSSPARSCSPRLKNHVQTVARHFQGKVRGWDVVTERSRTGNGNTASRSSYRVARPGVISRSPSSGRTRPIPPRSFLTDDYNLDADDAKRATPRSSSSNTSAQGAPIHGIGLQGQLQTSPRPPPAKIDEDDPAIRRLGLKVMITELDVEAIRDTKITGAIDATTGGTAPHARRRRARASSTVEAMKTKLALTEAQAAKIAPLSRPGCEASAPAITAGEFHLIGGSAAKRPPNAIRPLLTRGAARPPFTEIDDASAGGAPTVRRPAAHSGPSSRSSPNATRDLRGVHEAPRIDRAPDLLGLRDRDRGGVAPAPLLFDDHYARKPAYDAVIATAKK